jgi:hypothetical protein
MRQPSHVDPLWKLNKKLNKKLLDWCRGCMLSASSCMFNDKEADHALRVLSGSPVLQPFASPSEFTVSAALVG